MDDFIPIGIGEGQEFMTTNPAEENLVDTETNIQFEAMLLPHCCSCNMCIKVVVGSLELMVIKIDAVYICLCLLTLAY